VRRTGHGPSGRGRYTVAMRVLPAALIVLATLSCPAWADDEGAPARETTERWAAFSAGFAKQLVDGQREFDAMEEFAVLGVLRPNDFLPWSHAAYWALDLGTSSRVIFMPGSRFYKHADRYAASGLSRGGGQTDDTGLGADPRLSYIAGRLRFTDSSFSETDEDREQSTQGALAWFRLALDQPSTDGFDPAEVKPWFFRTAVNAAQFLTEKREAAKALELLDEADKRVDLETSNLDLLPLDLAYALIARAEAHRALDEHARAETIYREVIRTHPGVPRGHLGFGRVLMQQHKLDEAREELRTAQQQAALMRSEGEIRAEALVTLASAVLKMSPPRLAEAERAVAAFFEMKPDDPDGLYVLGLIAIERQDWEGARKWFRWVHRREPDDKQALAQLVKVLYQLGDLEGRDEVQAKLEALEKADREEREAAPEAGDADQRSDGAPEDSSDPGSD
jgi:tetratricopeptide (TPR) repeat protein